MSVAETRPVPTTPCSSMATPDWARPIAAGHLELCQGELHHLPGPLRLHRAGLLNQYVEAIRQNTLSEFKKRYREIDVLLLDDIQFIEGKEGLQEELFQTFESLYQANKQIVLSSDRPPDAISTLEDRLRSRFKMGLTTEIDPLNSRPSRHPSEEGRRGNPSPRRRRSWSSSPPTSPTTSVSSRAPSSGSAYANLTNQTLDVPLAEFVLDDLISDTQPRPITPALILEKTSESVRIPDRRDPWSAPPSTARDRSPGRDVRDARTHRSDPSRHRP